MTEAPLAVLGARSATGRTFAALWAARGHPPAHLLTRRDAAEQPGDGWCGYDDLAGILTPVVVSLMPIWSLTDRLDWLEEHGCRRLVALSSTSRFTKQTAARPSDRALAQRLADAEERLEDWARPRGVALVVVRPTMIYGSPDDGNVSSIAGLLRRVRVFPVVGPAHGLRQPVHVEDLAWAIAALAERSDDPPSVRHYNIGGGEVLTYRALVDRIRRTVPGPTAVVRVPAAVFTWAARMAPRSHRLSVAAGMAERMSQDMVFDHQAAVDDLGYAPRPFRP